MHAEDVGAIGGNTARESVDAPRGTGSARPDVAGPAVGRVVVARTVGSGTVAVGGSAKTGDTAVVAGTAAVAGSGRSAATRRVIGLTAELAAELSHFQTADLGAVDVHGLMHGMNCTAAALTRILDQLRESPVLAQTDNDLGLPRHHTVRSELEQAAAAAEDLQAAAESLCRLLPTSGRRGLGEAGSSRP